MHPMDRTLRKYIDIPDMSRTKDEVFIHCPECNHELRLGDSIVHKSNPKMNLVFIGVDPSDTHTVRVRWIDSYGTMHTNTLYIFEVEYYDERVK